MKVITFQDAIRYFKYSYSTVLLVFSVVMLMGCIFRGQSTATEYNIQPTLAVSIFWILIAWLGVMEGGQGCLVGLKPIPLSKFEKSHPLSAKNCKIAHEGNNLERFIIGRQFLVVLVIFLINMMGKATEDANPFPFLPNIVNVIFLQNGVAMMITTIDVGQLPAQVNAAVAMLDFIQNHVMVATTYISLGIEFSGLLHCVHLVQYGFAALTAKGTTNKDESSSSPSSRTIPMKLFFWLRVVISLGILGFALAVTIQALREGKSGMWDGVSPAVSIIIFFLLLCLVGLMEGMQIAAFALLNIPEDELQKHSSIAYKNCTLMFDGANFQSFLIGRQILVAALMFIVAKIATISVDDGETNIFRVPDAVQAFLNTGLLGAIVLTVVGSLAWRVIASSYPLLFMSNPIIYVIIRACFLLEATGICAASWLIALAIKAIFRLNRDDKYLDETVVVELSGKTIDSSKAESKRRRSSFAFRRLGSNIRASIRGSVVSLSSKELRINDDDDDYIVQMEKMRDSYVASSRLSAMISSTDLDAIMDEIDNGDDNYSYDDGYRRYTEEDEDENQQNKEQLFEDEAVKYGSI